jgi:hypothetical protein
MALTFGPDDSVAGTVPRTGQKAPHDDAAARFFDIETRRSNCLNFPIGKRRPYARAQAGFKRGLVVWAFLAKMAAVLREMSKQAFYLRLARLAIEAFLDGRGLVGIAVPVVIVNGLARMGLDGLNKATKRIDRLGHLTPMSSSIRHKRPVNRP